MSYWPGLVKLCVLVMCMTGCTGLVKTGDLVACSSGGALDSWGYLVRSVPEGTSAARVGKALL